MARELERGLSGHFIPIVPDIVPLRAFWIMSRQWDCDSAESERARWHFLDAYPLVEYCILNKKVLLKAFDLAARLRHDPFDASYLAAALEYRASGTMTTDTDFRRLCHAKNLDYVNPFPPEFWRSSQAGKRDLGNLLWSPTWNGKLHSKG